MPVIEPLTAEQVLTLADRIDPRYRAMVLLAAGCGLRWSEAAPSERTVAELLDAAAQRRLQRCRQAEAEAAAREALRERQREAARQRRLDELAKNPEAAWAQAGKLIRTKVPARYDEAVTLLVDLLELARRDGQAGEFERRFAALREEHLRKPSLIARFDRAGLTA